MNYSKILLDSLKLVLKNRYLWFLGLLLGGGSGANFYNYGNSGNWDKLKENDPDLNVAGLVSANVKDVGSVLGEKISSEINNTTWLLLALFILILILLIIYLSITAKGATTWAVSKLSEGEKFSLKDAWSKGHKYFWRRLSFSIIVTASIIILIAILALPVIVLAIFEQTILAVILGILFGIGLIAFFIYLSFFLPYSERILFLENKSVTNSIKSGFRLFNKNWLNLLLMYLILFAIGIGIAIALLIVLAVLALIVLGIGALYYYANHIAGYIVGATLSLVFIIALIIFSGALGAFNWAVITLSYKTVK